MSQDLDTLLEKVKELQEIHNEFKSKVKNLDKTADKKTVLKDLKNCKNSMDEIINLYDDLEDRASISGIKIPKNMRKDIYNMKHQIENADQLYQKSVDDYSRTKQKKALSSIDRVNKTLRTYEYRIDNNISEIRKKIREINNASSMKEERSIMSKINRIEDLEKEVKDLKSLVYHIYVSESSAKKVHKELINLHDEGMEWVETRQIAQNLNSNLNDVKQILNGLKSIDLVDKKIRGGSNVYRDKTKGKN